MVTDVLIANAITVAAVYFGWRLKRNEGDKAALFCLIFIGLLVAFIGYAERQ